jgi:NHL repeat
MDQDYALTPFPIPDSITRVPRRALMRTRFILVFLIQWAASDSLKAQQYLWTNFAGYPGAIGSADGLTTAARFNSPYGPCTDGSGNLYIADYSNSTVRKVTPAGFVSTLAGSSGIPGSTDGSGAFARFNGPVGTTVDGAGNVYVTDFNNHKWKASTITMKRIAP